MAKKAAVETKTTGRESKPMSKSEIAQTAKALKAYAVGFEELVAIMDKKEIKQISVTGIPSLIQAMDRLEKHYHSCRKALGILLVGEEAPRYNSGKQ